MSASTTTTSKSQRNMNNYIPACLTFFPPCRGDLRVAYGLPLSFLTRMLKIIMMSASPMPLAQLLRFALMFYLSHLMSPLLTIDEIMITNLGINIARTRQEDCLLTEHQISNYEQVSFLRYEA